MKLHTPMILFLFYQSRNPKIASTDTFYQECAAQTILYHNTKTFHPDQVCLRISSFKSYIFPKRCIVSYVKYSVRTSALFGFQRAVTIATCTAAPAHRPAHSRSSPPLVLTTASTTASQRSKSTHRPVGGVTAL